MHSLVVVNKDASIYEFGQMINIPSIEHNGVINSYFSAVPKTKWRHGMVISWEELTPMRNGLYTTNFTDNKFYSINFIGCQQDAFV